jgi:sulfide:quinone oxidoreductase
VSERDAFTFRPNTIYVPFGANPADLVVDLAKPFRRRHVEFVQGSVTGVDPSAHEVELADGRKLGYDKLVVATGAGMRPDAIPPLTMANPSSRRLLCMPRKHPLAERPAGFIGDLGGSARD